MGVYYTCDRADRLTGAKWYDAAGRITEVGRENTRGVYYTYNAVGNRTYQERGSAETYYEHDAANALTRRHELDGDSWSYFAYDTRGNCTEIQEGDGATYFEYNHADLVTSIHYKTGTWNPTMMHSFAGLPCCVDSKLAGSRCGIRSSTESSGTVAFPPRNTL